MSIEVNYEQVFKGTTKKGEQFLMEIEKENDIATIISFPDIYGVSD